MAFDPNTRKIKWCKAAQMFVETWWEHNGKQYIQKQRWFSKDER